MSDVDPYRRRVIDELVAIIYRKGGERAGTWCAIPSRDQIDLAEAIADRFICPDCRESEKPVKMDARSDIWLRSLDHLTAATKWQEKYGREARTELDWTPFWAALHAARTLAVLASVPVEVVKGAAELKAEQKQQEKQMRDTFAELFGEVGGDPHEQ